ncbi:unnamed protein product [Adineta ricciae]|uniref:F-box domain-containing protein n=1 Tax=Adineta ricciae TaxID=249248 RepID=A0A813YSQ1_ADIRI|nr:unnamed protein product [Adineta ricciae]
MTDYQRLRQNEDEETQEITLDVYITYKRRWFYLFIVCLAQISNAMIWINFSPIANLASEYYQVGYNAINWLSLIYMLITVPFTLPSTWLIDRLGVRSGLLIGTWTNAIGSLIRCLSVLSIFDRNRKFGVLMIGQTFCALAQTFILFIPTKFCFLWFSEKQRSFANSIAIGSGFFGILLGSILSPLIASTIDRIPLLLYVNVMPASCAALLCLAMRSAEPPTPSCKAVVRVQQSFTCALKRLFQSKSFVVLFLACGFAIGCFNALSTLIEQIMCTYGYDNRTIGFCLGWFIGMGSLGSLLFGYVADRTGKLNEISKGLYIASSIAYVLLAIFIVCRMERYLIYFAFALVGLVSLSLSPISMDLTLECVYPIPEATAIGVSVMSSQVIGILMVTVFPKFARPLNEHEMSIETCSKDVKHGLAILNYSIYVYFQMDQLPYEVLFEVASRIDSPRDLCSFSRVCSLFSTVSRDDRLWKRLCYQLYNVKPPVNTIKQSFYEIFTKILVPYGRYLGYWKSDEMFFGGLINVHLNLSDGNIIGEKIAPYPAQSEHDQFDMDDDESSFEPIYIQTKIFNIDTQTNQIFCYDCNLPHPELKWVKTFDNNEPYFGLSQEALPISERSSLILNDHRDDAHPRERDIHFIKCCYEHETIYYYPLSIVQPTTSEHDHPLSRLNGLWVGSYGGHGLELLHLEFFHEFTCPSVSDDTSTNEETISDALVARKISGDRNVPHGKISFAAIRPIEVESDSPLSYEGIGQIAHTNYDNPQFIRTKVVLLSKDILSVTWYALHHTSAFKRCIL